MKAFLFTLFALIALNAGAAPLNQTISFGPISSRPADAPPFPLIATASSGLAVSFRIVSGPATIYETTLTIAGGGTIVVEASQPGNAFYNAALPVTQSFSASKVNQSIYSFPQLPPKTFGAPPVALLAFTTSNLSARFRIISGPAVLAADTQSLSITGIGTIVVEAFQAGNAAYNPAPPVSQSFDVIAPVTSGPATYYFSTNGDDTRSQAQAQNPLTPWKTLTKFNSFFSYLLPGDAVLFEKGKTFYGSLVINASGSSALPVRIGAYGSGANPIITGLQNVSTWTPIGGNIYENTCSTCLANVSMVTFQDTLQPVGRWPKTTAPNAGYLVLQSHADTSSITSNAIASAPNFVGGEVVIRKYGWVIDRARVTGQTQSKVSYLPFNSPSHPGFTYEPQDQFGFFFQNHINALSQVGDWMYDANTKKFRMYFGAQNPANYSIQVATVDNLVNIIAENFIIFDGISFKGANSNGFKFYIPKNITITNCSIQFSGIDGIFMGTNVTKNITIKNCSVLNSNNNGISPNGSKNCIIQNNIVKNTGLIRGMGQSGDGQYNGIHHPGTNSLVEFNEVKNTGYIGIDFEGDTIIIKNNYIDSFCLIKSDGGGIYTVGEDTKKNRQILGNIIDHGIGDLNGRPQAEIDNPLAGNIHGIYIDGGATDVKIQDNTVANCASSGLELSSTSNSQIINNTLFNNTFTQIYYFKSYSTFTNLTVKNNIAFAKKSDQLIAVVTSDAENENTWGIIDSNYYCRPISEPQGVDTAGYSHSPTFFDYPDGGIIQAANTRFYSLDKWKTLSHVDAHTKKTPIAVSDVSNIRLEYNPTNVVKTIILNTTYIDVKNQSYSNTLNLAPYSSVILLRSGAALLNQTISFAPLAAKIFGAAPFTLSATASSGLPVSFRIVSGPATLSGNTLTITGVGTVVAEASQPGNAAYNPATPVTQSFNVAPANQVISFTALANKTVGDPSFILNATASSGLAVSFTLVSGPATLSGNTVTITGAGTVVIQASQPGNAFYNPATPVTQSFNVSGVTNYTLTATAGVNGSISPNGAVNVAGGASQTFTITPNNCFQIANVTVDGVSQGAIGTYTFTNVTANHTISATFSQSVFTITAGAGANGTIGPNGAVPVNCGANQTFSITPNAGFAVQNVLIDGVSAGAITTYTFSNVTSNHTISATFGPAGCTAPTFLTSNAIIGDASCGQNDGSISIIPTSGTAPFMYSLDGGVTYVSGPNGGFTFSNLAPVTYHLRLKSAGGCESIIVDKTVHTPTLIITASVGANGSISPNGGVIVNCGANQTFSISPNAGFVVQNVITDGVSRGAINTYTFTNVTANHTISASFVAGASFSITASAGANGSISPNGAVSVPAGTGQTFAITANSCYQIANVIVDGLSQGAIASYTFTNVTANHTISATFSLRSFTITASAGVNGTISPNGPVAATCGASQAFTITPNAGFSVQNVLVDGVSQGAVTSYTFTNLSANHTISATFSSAACTTPVMLNSGGIVQQSTCGGSNGNISIIPTSGTPPFVYSIDGGATYIAGANGGYTFENLAAGLYHLRLKSVNGSCESAVVDKTIITVFGPGCPVPPEFTRAAVSAGHEELVSVYPNPSNGQFKAALQYDAPIVEMSVTDGVGMIIETRRVNITKYNIIDFDLSRCAPGLYYLKTVTKNGTKISKVLIQ